MPISATVRCSTTCRSRVRASGWWTPRRMQRPAHGWWRFGATLLWGNDGGSTDSGECAASIYRDRGGSAAVLPDAGHVSVEFASQGLYCGRDRRLGEVPLLRRRVHSQERLIRSIRFILEDAGPLPGDDAPLDRR